MGAIPDASERGIPALGSIEESKIGEFSPRLGISELEREAENLSLGTPPSNMIKTILMTAADIHDFGIEVVIKECQKEGYTVESANNELGQNPQIVAKKNGKLIFVFVRTACYPDKGKMESDRLHFRCIEHAERFNALPYFASVGICNSSGETEAEMATPIKGAGYYVAYEGMLLMAPTDGVTLMSDDGTVRPMPPTNQ